MQFVKEFIIGSSGLLPLLFYTIYFKIPNENKTISNETYVKYVPIYFGIMNIVMIAIKNHFKFTTLTSIFVTTLVSSSFIFTVAYSNKVYKIKDMNWFMYYIILFILHFIAYTVISSFNILLI